VSKPLNNTERRILRQKAQAATLDALRVLGGEAQREAIREWALAHGGFSARELAAAPPESAAGQYPRLVDHQLSWALTNLKRDGLLENPQRSTWRLTSAALPTIATAVEEAVAPERLAELRAMRYQLYLRTPEWRRTRAAALLRAGNACSLDETHTNDLEVHHRTYERLGAELVTDLVVLCHSCHQLHHKEYGRPRRERSITPPQRGAATDNLAAASTVRPSKPSLLRRLLTNWRQPPSRRATPP
jgi:restriction endonuclease Mrr